MKRFTRIFFCVIAIIIISILFCQICSYGDNTFEENTKTEQQCAKIECKEFVITQYKKEASNDFLWETLSKYVDNEKIIAGIMGYFYRESSMRSDAIAGWGTRDKQQKCDTSLEFTIKVDEGLADGSSKEYFIKQVHTHFGGYGLGQWMSERYLDKLYDFAQEWGTSIGDAEMQCAFTVWSIEHQTPKLWEQLQNETNILTIGRKIGHLYDGTGEFGSETIASLAQGYYKKYGTQ